jgi:hypothetical protein
MCDLEGRRYTYSCPNETLFQQRLMICDHWYMVNCNTSEQDYAANELIGQRDKPFVGPEEHLYHREPGTVFPYGLLHFKSDGICISSILSLSDFFFLCSSEVLRASDVVKCFVRVFQ